MDVVQVRLERMLLEIQDLEKKKLFSKKELKLIINKRRDFEFKLKRRVAEKQDYLNYFVFESNLEQLRELRKEKRPTTKLSISDFSIKRRINWIFEKALVKFNGDISLWLQYIKYNADQKQPNVVKKILAK